MNVEEAKALADAHADNIKREIERIEHHIASAARAGKYQVEYQHKLLKEVEEHFEALGFWCHAHEWYGKHTFSVKWESFNHGWRHDKKAQEEAQQATPPADYYGLGDKK